MLRCQLDDELVLVLVLSLSIKVEFISLSAGLQLLEAEEKTQRVIYLALTSEITLKAVYA
jgi:hypothetical protein